MSDLPALQGEHLTRTFLLKEAKRTITALDDVSINIASGTLTALVGDRKSVV